MTADLTGKVGVLWLCLVAAVAFGPNSAVAGDRTSHSSIRLRVGETRSLGTFGGHSNDCTKSIPPEIRIVNAGSLGTISEQEGVPYVARTSLSGTCLGARFIGTEVRYSAASPGTETIAFDAVFANGTDHHTVSVTVH